MIYLALLCVALSAWPWFDRSNLLADYFGQTILFQCAAYGLIACACLAFKRWKSAFIFIGIIVIQLGLVSYSFAPLTRTETIATPQDFPRLRVLSFNFWRENKEMSRAFDMIHNVDADIVWIPEVLKRPYWKMMQEFEKNYPYRYPESLDEAAQEGSVLMSKYPFTIDFNVKNIGGIENRIAHATLNIKDKRLDFIGLHVLSPRTTEHLLIHNQQLAATGSYILSANIPKGTPLIVAGDMNSAVWRPSFIDFMQTVGVSPTSSLLSFPLTWPSWLPYPFQIAIDHILVSPDLCHSDLKRTTYSGSDHFPVYVDVYGC